MKKSCIWILRPASPGVTAVFCCKPVDYIMAKDDDGNRVRKYKSFCVEHEKCGEDDDEDFTE